MNPLSSIAGAALAAVKLAAETPRHPLDIDATVSGSVVELRYGSHAEAARALSDLRAILDRASTPAARDVLAERERAQTVEGWTAEHDDVVLDPGELSAAGSAYALAAADLLHPASLGDAEFSKENPPPSWPEDWEFKPGPPRRMLVKAAQLILAEIERLDRAAERAAQMETKA